jgi:hypothetical protein
MTVDEVRHMVISGLMVRLKPGATITVIVSLSGQGGGTLLCTTYVVVTVGEATGLGQVAQLNPTGGPPPNTVHVKVVPPVALSCTGTPQYVT